MRISILLLVIAVSAIPTSSWAVPPPAPGPCSAAIVNTATSKGVQLVWFDVPGETGYRVYRNETLVAETPANISSLFDQEYPVPGDYAYCVEAFNADGASPQCCHTASSTLTTIATVAPEDWYQDTFPATENAGLAGTAAYDTAGAYIRSGRNIVAPTGTLMRSDVPAEGARLTPGLGVARVDLIFRILPGPGNYVTIGSPSSGLVTVPAAAPRAPAAIAPPDGSFWTTYITFNGMFGTGSPGTNGIPHHALGTDGTPWSRCWDPTTWNSAQCALVGGIYLTNHFAAPATPILPDGLLPAGSHVEYFFRVTGTDASLTLIPDTSMVLQADGQRSIDGHRWEAFSVLPDRWKSPAYGGFGDARMLVVDLDDRRGNERIWAGIADSIGATAQSRWGAHTGWHAAGGGADIDLPANFVARHIGQPGTTWDLYNVRGVESVLTGNAGALGSRYAIRPAPPPFAGMESRQGPTTEVLGAYYRQLLLFTGDLHEWILGRFPDRSQDDVHVLETFMLDATPFQPRGVFIEGEGFAESESKNALIDHATLLQSYLGLSVTAYDYRAYASNHASSAGLTTVSPHTPGTFDAQNNGDGDVLDADTSVLPEAVVAANWEDVGGGPYPASVYKPVTATNPWTTLVDGWNIARLGAGKGYTCLGCLQARPAADPDGAQQAQSAIQRLSYFYGAFNNLFASVGSFSGGPTTDAPQSQGRIPFLTLANNPLVSGALSFQFSVPRADRVRIDVFDALGRRVRHLVDREYPAGAWEARWDGLGDDGRVLPRGVFFAQAHLVRSGVSDAKHCVVLK